MATRKQPVSKVVNAEILDLGFSRYDHAVGLDDMERDEDGFILLKPTAVHVDAKKAALTTDISSLEEKLKKFKEEKTKLEKYQATDDYKESKKKLSKKKQKKQKISLLESVFNNADHVNDEIETDAEEDEDSDITYKDKKSKSSSATSNKKKETTLDTTYGKRFSPVVAMLHDTIIEFDSIAADIESDLKNSKNTSRTMYRSSQIGNLISAKNSKLSAVKELASVAKTVSDLEYKKEKDKAAVEGLDSNKAISAIGAKYLRGGLDFLDYDKKGKKDKDKKKSSSSKKKLAWDDDDDEEDDGIKKQRSEDQKALASEFAKSLSNRKGDINLSPHERYIKMEGKYVIQVVADPLDLDDWEFIAIDPKTGKKIKDFKEDYPGLLPKKRSCRMMFDLVKLRATDKNSARVYKLLLKD